MKRTNQLIGLAPAGIAAALLTACTGSEDARKLAAETRNVVKDLRVDGERIIAADRRTERLTASLIGARRQVVDQALIEQRLEQRAGLSSKAKLEQTMQEIKRVAGEDLGLNSIFDNAAYRPEVILADLPASPSPLTPLATADAKLAELEKPLTFAERTSIYLGLASELGKTLSDAAAKAEAAEKAAEGEAKIAELAPGS